MLVYAKAVRNRSRLLKRTWPWKWIGKKELIYYISYYNQNESIVIEEWFETDLASSPCFTHCIIPKEKFLISYIHDALYTWKLVINVEYKQSLSEKFKALQKHWTWITKNKFKPNRKFADKLFYYWMIEENLEFYWKRERFKPLLWYLWVRLFGWARYWKK